MEHAKIEDIKEMSEKIKDNWSLCNFMGKCEREYLVAETIHASVINHKNHGEPFSFNEIKGATRLCDNFTAFDWLISNGYFIEGKREGRNVIFTTQLLIDKLKVFFAEQSIKTKM